MPSEKELFLSTTDLLPASNMFSRTIISANSFFMNIETQLIIVKIFLIMIMKIKIISDLKWEKLKDWNHQNSGKVKNFLNLESMQLSMLSISNSADGLLKQSKKERMNKVTIKLLIKSLERQCVSMKKKICNNFNQDHLSSCT